MDSTLGAALSGLFGTVVALAIAAPRPEQSVPALCRV